MPQEKNNPKLSEQEADRKAMLFWTRADKPEGQYRVYRKAVELWNKMGAIEGDLDKYLRQVRKANFFSWLPETIAWPWVTGVIVPIGAAITAIWVVLHEVRANREFLQTTIEAQREQNRQQILKDYIEQMTLLIAERNLANKYPKNQKGEFASDGIPYPESIAASSLTKTVLKLLGKRPIRDNAERGALLIFLNESRLIHEDQPIINLDKANFRGADLFRADLTKVDLKGVNLKNATLVEAKLYGADLSGAELIGADLTRANLNLVDFTGVNLYGADLTGASLAKVAVSRARFIRVTGLSERQKDYLRSHGAIME